MQDMFIGFLQNKKREEEMYSLSSSVVKLHPFYYSHIVTVVIQPRS